MRTQSETFHFGTFSGRRQKYDLEKKASMNRFCLSGITQDNESCSAARITSLSFGEQHIKSLVINP